MSSSNTKPGRFSMASDTTLVNTSNRERNNSIKDDFGRKTSLGTSSTTSRGSSLPGFMDKAMKKVKSKLKDREVEMAPKPKAGQPARDSYPDAAFMWRALAGKKLPRGLMSGKQLTNTREETKI
ncbi:hypothetical protein AAE478_010274 [Parahypoxylon ruwenzoriense]